VLRSRTRICCLFLLTCIFLLPSTSFASTTSSRYLKDVSATLPGVDPAYVYNQLFYMGTHFLRREAGYDNNLPPDVNGHDEFAAYWTQEIMKNLQGFAPQARRDAFAVQGWVGRQTTVPAVNVEVSVPGVTHPEQVVVIGCHYDGEAISTQSAFDDASGCAIELGVAKAMGAYWHSQHVYPARTLRFVIFDAEEQGLYGSFHYVNSTINGDLSNIVAMFNEEQNGIAYPLRYLGELSNPLLPFYIEMAPLQNNGVYTEQSQLPAQRRDAIASFRALMQQAISNVFNQFRALGFQNLTYHTNNNTQNVSQPIFTPDQLSSIHTEDDPGLGSDQIAFTMAGVPCVTFVGDGTHQDKGIMPPYPFDTSVDTIQLMNTYADGSSRESQALALALALPGMLTTWMLVEPTLLGQVAADANPIASINDIGQTQVGKSIALDASASFNAGNPGNTLSYSWNFGDGTSASGVTVEHTYKTAGNYTLTLTVTSPGGGSRVISKTISVTAQPPDYANPFAGYRPTGNTYIPQGMPTPDDRLTDQVSPASLSATTSPIKQSTPTVLGSTPAAASSNVPLIVGIGVAIVLLMLIVLVSARRRRPSS
jgi:hypothetical protein